MNGDSSLVFGWDLSWWQLLLTLVALAVLIWQSYRLLIIPMPLGRRLGLAVLRASWLLLLLWCLLDPRLQREWQIERDVRPEVTMLIDSSASMAAGDTARWQQAMAMASRLEAQLLAAGAAAVDKRACGAELRPFSDQPATDQRSELIAQLQTVGHSAGSLERPRRVVLISDGADTAGATPAVLDDTVPCYPVVYPALQQSPASFRIAAVDAPGRAVVRQRLPVLVAIDKQAVQASVDYDLVVRQDDADVFRVAIPARVDGRSIVQVAVPVGERGPSACSLRIEQRTADAGRLVLDEAQLAWQVVEDIPKRYLYVQGALDWELRFVRQAVTDNPSVQLDTIIRLDETRFLEQRAGARQQQLIGEALAVLDDEQALQNYAGIIIHNCTPALLGEERQQIIKRFVVEHGGGVLFFNGDATSAAAYRESTLTELLPVALGAGKADPVAENADITEFMKRVTTGNMLQEEQIFADKQWELQQASGGTMSDLLRMRISSAGRRHAIFTKADGGATGRLQAPPPHFKVDAELLQAKPGARVLAVHPQSGRPLLAVQDVGAGRSAVLGLDALWRWRMQAPSQARDYDQFWQQMLAWLAARMDAISVRGLQEPVTPGTELALELQLPMQEQEWTLWHKHAQQADWQAVSLQWSEGKRQARARVTAALGSELELRAGAKAGWRQRALVRVADPERDHCAFDRSFLQQVAQQTGGQLLEEGDLELLPQLLGRRQHSEAGQESRSLWHGPWLFLVILGIYCTELFLRKRFQLS